MSSFDRCRQGAAGVVLVLLAATGLEAQERPLPGRIKLPPTANRQPAAQPAGPQVAAGATQAVKALLPCCVVEGVEQSVRGAFLVVKNTQTGERHRVRVARGSAGQVASAASSGGSSGRYRPGQLVDMNLDKTAIAVTPFPVKEYQKKKINGNSAWVMKTWVTVSDNGKLDGKTNIKSAEAARGFTGGVEVVLTDRAGNILHQTALRTYGVNGTAMGGKSERTINWSENVSGETLNKVRAVVIHHSYEPKVRLAAGLGWIKDNWKLVAKVYKCGKEFLSEDGAVATTTPPPPPPPGQPTSQSQPAPADNPLMECFEATQELAHQLGY